MKSILKLTGIIIISVFVFVSCAEDGDDGRDGVDGLPLLVETGDIYPGGEYCSDNGGIRIDIGHDTNENGVLDPDEIIYTEYVCHGVHSNPFVVYTYPTQNQINVNPDVVISVVFNTEMDPDTIDETTFTLKDEDGNPVDGDVSCSGIFAEFYPDEPLDFSMKYTISIDSNVENIKGIELGYDYNSYFTTQYNHNAYLSGLLLSDGTLNPQFDKDMTSYSAQVDNETEEITVTPATADQNATVKVEGDPVDSGSPSGEINLDVGLNTITIIVTAQDGITTRTYTVDVTRLTVTESAFYNATTPGEQVTVPAGDVEFKMNYANNQESITFPFSPDRLDPVDDQKETIEHKFFMAETQVTYELWYEVYQWATTDAGDGKRADGGELYTFQHPGRMGSDADGIDMTDQHPVTMVSWRDAIIWCNALSEMTGAEVVYVANGEHGTIEGNVLRSSVDDVYDGENVEDVVQSEEDNLARKGYRLPAIKEWEYAARYIGTTDPGDEGEYGHGTNLANDRIDGSEHEDLTEGYYWTPAAYASGATADYNNEDATQDVAWYSANSGSQTQPVGLKIENALGLYDMSGNIWEWCFSIGSGSDRVTRGGGWHNSAYYLRVGCWFSGLPDLRYSSLGFRFARTQ